MKEYLIEDPELGNLIVHVNPRAVRFTFRSKEDAIYITVPSGATSAELKKAIEQVRDKLSEARKKIVKKLIDLDYKIEAAHFKLKLIEGHKREFTAHSELGEMHIICPPNTRFEDEALQEWLHKVIVEALRRNAKIVLPPRLSELARKFGLSYKHVKINSSKGRWGSCSYQKGINLSCFLMLLPDHLIDYVLLHELTHTLEMNHSERFWALLNQYTDGKALALRKEMKEYRTAI